VKVSRLGAAAEFLLEMFAKCSRGWRTGSDALRSELDYIYQHEDGIHRWW
jgi:hypothetical protein